MQDINFLKSTKYLGCFVVTCLMVLTIASCNKSDAAPEVSFKGILNTLNVVNNSGASRIHGNVTATYNPSTKKLNYTVEWHGFSGNTGSIVRIIFYKGAVGVNGPEIFRLSDFATGIHGVETRDYQVPEALEEDLMNGNFYVVVTWQYDDAPSGRKLTVVRANLIPL